MLPPGHEFNKWYKIERHNHKSSSVSRIVARVADRIFSKDASAARVKIYDILFLRKTLLRRVEYKICGSH